MESTLLKKALIAVEIPTDVSKSTESRVDIALHSFTDAVYKCHHDDDVKEVPSPALLF